MKEKIEKIENLLKELPSAHEEEAKEIEAILKEIKTEIEKEKPVLKEVYHTAETIDNKGNYKRYEYRTIGTLGFYIRPIRDWYWPCVDCQKKLQKLLSNGTWILGNKSYKPDIELNTTKDEVDDDYEVVLEKHKATEEEIERIGIDGWEEIK